MNSITLMGRLVRDPECKMTTTGKTCTTCTIAVNRPQSANGQNEADFINLVAWGKTAETMGNYVSKGQRILVQGRLQIRSYDAKDGSKKWITEVIVNNMEFIEKREQQNNNPAAGFGMAQPDSGGFGG